MSQLFSEFCLALYEWMSDKKYEVHTEILTRKGGGGGIGGWREEGGGLRWNSTNRKLIDREESKDRGQEASKETGRGTRRKTGSTMKTVSISPAPIMPLALHFTVNPIYVFPEMKLHSASFPNLGTIYIFPGSVCPIGCRNIGRQILKIYKSLTDTRM
jgi:hypothetical protein